MSVLLAFQDLAVSRSDRTLLRSLAGEVRAGEILHIRGANGVGKTSLLEVLMGLRHAESGTVHRNFEPDDAHWIGHRNGLNPALTPVENLRFWCDLQGAGVARTTDALRSFALNDCAHRPCRQLSAGQKRRAALARLAVQRRTVWFLDEPLSGLDQLGIEHWRVLLADHQAGRGAAVITSHQPLPALPGLRSMELA